MMEFAYPWVLLLLLLVPLLFAYELFWKKRPSLVVCPPCARSARWSRSTARLSGWSR